jgi:hypothetical protein
MHFPIFVHVLQLTQPGVRWIQLADISSNKGWGEGNINGGLKLKSNPQVPDSCCIVSMIYANITYKNTCGDTVVSSCIKQVMGFAFVMVGDETLNKARSFLIGKGLCWPGRLSGAVAV